MTLVVATKFDGGIWMGADRLAGGGSRRADEMAGTKVTERSTPDGMRFLLGFAGSARVAQRILRLDPPARADWQTLEGWLTCWSDSVYTACNDVGLVRDREDEGEVYLAGWTAMLLAAEGRLFLVGHTLHWHEPACGWLATGVADEVFTGAYELLRDIHDPVDAVRLAWPIAQRHFDIGTLADELTLGT